MDPGGDHGGAVLEEGELPRILRHHEPSVGGIRPADNRRAPVLDGRRDGVGIDEREVHGEAGGHHDRGRRRQPSAHPPRQGGRDREVEKGREAEQGEMVEPGQKREAERGPAGDAAEAVPRIHAPDRASFEQGASASVSRAPETRQKGRSATRLPSAVPARPTAAPRGKTTSRRTRTATTWTSGSSAAAISPTTNHPAVASRAGTPAGAGGRPAVGAPPAAGFGPAIHRPSQVPSPVRSSQFPRTIPTTSSLPVNAASNSRIMASCVMTADAPTAPVATRIRPSLERAGLKGRTPAPIP